MIDATRSRLMRVMHDLSVAIESHTLQDRKWTTPANIWTENNN